MKTTRVQLELSEKSFGRLQALKETTEAASYAEVIRNALRLYEGLIREEQAGNTLSIQTKDGKKRELHPVFS